jgi:hypothetical protein
MVFDDGSERHLSFPILSATRDIWSLRVGLLSPVKKKCLKSVEEMDEREKSH